MVSDKTHLLKLKNLSDCLELYDIRNAIAHPNRPFPDCYWYRLAAIANDPVIDILSFKDVKQAFISAMADKITDSLLPSEEWFSAYVFTLPNNLPKTLDHEITGLIGRDREKAELLKKLKSKKFALIALVGPGGTGKTAIALDLLRDAVLDPKTYDWADEIVFVTAKTERLTKDGPIPIDNPIASIEDVKSSIAEKLIASNELDHPGTLESVSTSLDDKKILLCLDNLETLLRDHPEPFEELYASLPDNWRLLVTSRVPVDSATNLTINPMQVGPAVALARNYLQKRGGSPLDAAVFDQLVEKTDCNPLAIRISVDSLVSGLDVATALSQTRESILEFSYTNLLKNLPEVANKVLECMFAANRKLTRHEIRSLLNDDIDQVAIGVQSLLRTSLVTRHADENVESYSLSSSIRDLLLRTPLDDSARTSVFQRLAEQQHTLTQIKSQDQSDPLDEDYIPGDFPEAIAHNTYRAFQMIRRKEPKAVIANQLDLLRGDCQVHNEAALYRATAALLLELNDRDSARQILEQSQSRNAFDPAARLMLAELYKNEKRLDECYSVSEPLRSKEWIDDKSIGQFNIGRVARVTWLVGIWLGKALQEIPNLSDWDQNPALRAIKGTMYSTAIRRLLESEKKPQKTNNYIREILYCLDQVLRVDGYVGFVVKEAAKAINEISHRLKTTNLDVETAKSIIEFLDTHLRSLCNVQSAISINDPEIQLLIETVRVQSASFGLEADSIGLESTEDPVLAQYGYIPATVYAIPVDSFGFARSFIFAEDTEGIQYHISKRVFQEPHRFAELQKGDPLLILPREDYDEEKARPVQDAIISD